MNENVTQSEVVKKETVGVWLRKEVESAVVRHRMIVSNYMSRIGRELTVRGRRHDRSILLDPMERKALFDLMEDVPDDNASIDTALARDYNPVSHLENNDHHIEHFKEIGGIGEMNLFQLTELLCDTMARAEATNTPYLVELNNLFDNYNVPEAIQNVLRNTLQTMMEDRRYGTESQ